MFAGMAMIGAAVVRALVVTAAFAAALTPCLGETSNPSPPKATKELPPELLALLRQKKMPKHSPILMRIFKEEAELEVCKQDSSGRFEILKTFPICRWSGDLGPKFYEGDRQACNVAVDPQHRAKAESSFTAAHRFPIRTSAAEPIERTWTEADC